MNLLEDFRWAFRTLVLGEHPSDQHTNWELSQEVKFYRSAYERVFEVVYEADSSMIEVEKIRTALLGR